MSTRLEVAVILQLAVRLQHRIAFRFGVWILLHVKAVGHPGGGTFLLRNQAIFIVGGHTFAGIATGARLDDRLTGIGNLAPDVFGSPTRSKVFSRARGTGEARSAFSRASHSSTVNADSDERYRGAPRHAPYGPYALPARRSSPARRLPPPTFRQVSVMNLGKR